MRRSGLIIALVASLALNLFLIGAGAGIAALGAHIARERAAERPAVFHWATQPMSPPARRRMRQMLIGVRDQVRPDIERSRALRIQAWSALAAPQPDVAAIKQMLAQSRQTDIAARAKVEDAIVDRATGLPRADRAALAAGFRRTLEVRAAAAKP